MVCFSFISRLELEISHWFPDGYAFLGWLLPDGYQKNYA